ncbi:acyltransferase family protein [Vibrio splendidus]|uniref:acyltransferase family protein n=1 Tax=Vibrio splendidus TaxID=29497 RepID=UPI000C837B15|nr:acyltransferase [Vibrio splendidus]PMI52937.1 hypothetical protein BCU42_02705 [Vibrio splendidus]
MKKDYGINNLRGIVALWVMLGHYEVIYLIVANTEPKLFEVIKYFDPVGIFLLISGYLIPLSLERYGSKEFLIRRIFRIWPVVVFCSTFHYLFIGGSLSNYINTLFLSFDLTRVMPQVSVYWSLSIEVYFYLILALIFWSNKSNLAKSLIVGVIASIGLYAIPYLLDSHYYMSVASRYSALLIYIFIGSIIYMYRNNNSIWYMVMGLVFILAMYVMMQVHEYSNSLLYGDKFKSEYPDGVFVISETRESRLGINDYFYSKIASLMVFLISIKFFTIKSRLLDFFADISYPIYIFHMTIYIFVFSMGLDLDKYYLVFLSTILSLFTCWIIHIFIENKSNHFVKNRSVLYSKLKAIIK